MSFVFLISNDRNSFYDMKQLEEDVLYNVFDDDYSVFTKVQQQHFILLYSLQ